jgi:hypothetical protein
VEAQVEAVLAAVVKSTPVNIHPCDISKEIYPLKLGNLVVLMAIQINVSSMFLEDLLLI